MNYLITGGAGFIGGNFIAAALAGKLNFNFKKIYVLDKLTYAANLGLVDEISKDSRVIFIKGDICDDSLLNEIFPDIDAVINFAAESHVDRSITESKNFILSNILGTDRLLSACVRHNVKKFLQVSTDEVYGSLEQGFADENYPLVCSSPYAASKASADLVALSYGKTHEIQIVITRCSNNYGDFQNSEKLIPTIIQQALKGNMIPIYGTGLNSREWIHVLDHCQAIATLANLQTVSNIYNIGTGNILNNLEIAKQILDLMSVSHDSISLVQDRKGHDWRYAINSSKIRQDIGWAPIMNFKSGLKSTIEYYTKIFTD